MNPFIKPWKKLTDPQAAAMMARIIARRQTPKLVPPAAAGAIPREAAMGALGQAPTSVREYGQLRDLDLPQTGPRTYPIEEAMKTYMGNPGRFEPVGGGAPPAQHIYPTGGGPEVPGGGIANEIMKFRQVRPPGSIGVENAIKQTVPEMAPTTKTPEAVDKSDLIQLSIMLDDVWQIMGGHRSTSGKLWDQLRLSSRTRTKPASAKDYFVTSAMNNSINSQGYSQRYPRESKLLNQIYDIYLEKTGVDLRNLKE